MKNGKLWLALCLTLVLVVGLCLPMQAEAAGVTVYLDPANGADTNAGTEAAPVKTLEAAYGKLTEGGTVVFLSDLSITADTFFPACAYPVTLTSKTGNEGIYTTGNLRMQAATTFKDITLTFNASGLRFISGEGYDLTIDTGVTTVNQTSNQVNLLATKRYNSTLKTSPTLTVRSGNWNYIYATHGNSLTGDVTVVMEGGSCKYISPCYDATVTGNVNITVKNGTVSSYLYTEPTHANGKITGNLTVTLGDGADVTKVTTSNGVVQGSAFVRLDGEGQSVDAMVGYGAGSNLVLCSGTYSGSASGYGATSIDVPAGKTLTLAGAVTADTVKCAGTLNFEGAGALTAAAVEGAVNCTITGDVMGNKAYVTAPADADIRFPASTGVINENGQWIVRDTSEFKGMVIKAESDVTMVFYKDHDRQEQDKIQPDFTQTDGDYTYYYFAGAKGYYCYDASKTGYYTIYQRVYMTAAEAATCTVEEVVMEKRGDGWDYRYYYGQVDEYIQNSEYDMSEKWHTEVPLVTPVFTNEDKAAHQMTTQAELEAFIQNLDDADDNMYIFSIGKSAKYQHDIPIVFFTKTDLSDCTTLEEVAAKLEKDGLYNVGYKAQMHGDEHAAGEGALGVINLLDKEENQYLLDSMNIYVMPRTNPDGAQECQRVLRQQSLLFPENESLGSSIDPNRHMLTLAVHEARLYLKTVQLFHPVAELDGHERQRSSNIGDNQIGASWFDGRSQELLDIQVEMIYSMFDALKAVDLSGAWYDDRVSTTPSAGNTRSYGGAQGRIHLLMETRGIYLGNECYATRTASHIVSAMAYLNFCAENVEEIARIVAAEQQDLINRGKTYEETDTVTLSSVEVAHPEYTITTEKANFATGTIDKTYRQVPNFYEASRTRVAPTAYVIPKNLPKIEEIVELMDLEEIAYYEVPANTAILLQQYSGTVSDTWVTSNVTLSEERYFTFPEGAYVFQMDQANAYLLAMLMEPDAASLDLVQQDRITVNGDGTFPIYRYIHDLNAEDKIDVVAAPSAPANLTWTAPTDGNNGVIAGLDTALLYEYRVSGDESYTAVPAGSDRITGLAEGKYYIRVQSVGGLPAGGETFVSLFASYTVYLDQTNGSDDNDGYAETAAVKTLSKAISQLTSRLEGMPADYEGTIILLSDYISTSQYFNIPSHTYPVVFTSKTGAECMHLNSTESKTYLTLGGDTTFENMKLGVTSTSTNNYLCGNGYKLVVGENVDTTGGTKIFNIIGGNRSKRVASADISIASGTWQNIYISGSTYGVDGDAKLVMTGGTVKSSITPGYSVNTEGNVTIILENVNGNTIYCGNTNSYHVKGNVDITLGEGVTFKTFYAGSRDAGNVEGTVTVTVDGADLTGIKLVGKAANSTGTVGKSVLVYKSGTLGTYSDFTEFVDKSTTEPEVVKGDLNGDGNVSDADAMYLLRYTLFGDSRYPLNQGGDVNGDGAISDADAMYLLRFTLFGPSRYPLH